MESSFPHLSTLVSSEPTKPAPKVLAMAEHRKQLHRTDNMKYFFHENGPSTSKVVTVATLLPIGGTLLLLSGMSFIGSLIGLAMAAPIFLTFSPVLVPAALLIAGSVAGFLTSGAFGITGLSSLSWIGNFVRGYMYQQLQNKSQDP
ncbi:Oleosin 18.2 kDa [Hibiscus syriacus]|uniref:Oleosin 18.2 kDa n=1 Tax=Hibiscus syriacus TaxID=106335 RepID=A0A6A3CA84_HIBSY|nr:Oleosin 18.2 kDa [Hibiscus syriacus]